MMISFQQDCTEARYAKQRIKWTSETVGELLRYGDDIEELKDEIPEMFFSKWNEQNGHIDIRKDSVSVFIEIDTITGIITLKHTETIE